MPGPSKRAAQKALTTLSGQGSARDMTSVSRAQGAAGVAAQMFNAREFVMNGALGRPLPRPDLVFTAGEFGPDQPMLPVPVDVPGLREGGPSPRFWEYPIAWNAPIGPRAFEAVSFSLLRQVSRVDAVRAAIQLLKDEVVSVPWRIKVKDPDKARENGPTYLKAERDAITNWFEVPDRTQGLEFDEWAKELMEELLVTDALTIYPLRSIAPNGVMDGPVQSDLIALQIIDGATIKPLLDLRGGRPASPSPAYQQFLYGVARSEFAAQQIEGMDPSVFASTAQGNFTVDELIYKPYVRRANSVYGFPPVEQVIFTAITWLSREQWWQSYFSDSDLPAMFITGGEGWSVDQLERWEQALHALLSGDPTFRWRLKALPHGSTVEQMKQPNFDVMFDEFMLKIIAMVFRLTTSEYFGMSSKSGLGGRGFLEEQAGVQERKAVWPYRRRIETLLTQVIATYFHQPELCFRFDDQDLADAYKQAQIDDIYVKNGTRAISEIRADHAWGDLGLEEANTPYIETRAGITPLNKLEEVIDMLIAQGNAGAAGGGAGNPQQVSTATSELSANAVKRELRNFEKFVKSEDVLKRPFNFRDVPEPLARALNAAVRGYIAELQNPEV